MSRPDKGFSLVELLAAVAISTIIIAGFTTFYLSEQHSYQHGRMDIDTSQALRTALDQITRDLRVASRNPLDATTCGFLTATATEVDFTFDADDDGVCGESTPREFAGFRRTGTTLENRVAVGTVADWETLAENVVSTGTIFTYQSYDASTDTWNPLTAPVTGGNLATIGRVGVTLSFSRTGPIGGIRKTETASVTVRNKTL